MSGLDKKGKRARCRRALNKEIMLLHEKKDCRLDFLSRDAIVLVRADNPKKDAVGQR